MKLAGYIAHARKYGTFQIFETAYWDNELSHLEIAQLVQELRKIQNSNRKGWINGAPMVHSRRPGKPMVPGESSPPGIIGEKANDLIEQLLSAGIPKPRISKLLGVSAGRIAEVEALIAPSQRNLLN